ncbi:tRNA (adenosine(37)-N6)-threonylcarbamoyltransferase complex dimerization subunit type 1 TsaB [Paludisphaera borealis]|uniref:tRNA threonylcarbamoyladenosine biosynthesis protein TsaB n=1 Tax=Paludisphaera borealis TaxID=1387353 RepID=A0A1U7CPK7_9BACT|nr:tRNA (adenosine(37)-N6)-threonylcarbamoyltransferase complex dimerization subunit type 1 TsaB [Paludisphaera borealis]APW60875.1 tRNA threonylcarbamoyladenosine biosynthesis protein TsaB [Paludisphaera borealis]
MNFLALDTSGDRSAAGVGTAAGLAWEAATDASRKHGRDLAPMIRDLLLSAGLKPVDLTTIAVGLGPGSYTGLRIGLTAARMLAYAAGARILAFDSLEGFAQNAPDDALKVWAVADAQRGDVYCAAFERTEAGGALTAVAPSRIEPFGRWAEGLEAGTLVLGPALNAEAIRSALPSRVVAGDSALNQPSGRRLVELARRIAASGAEFDLFSLEPNYIRRSAAEDLWDARAGRP